MLVSWVISTYCRPTFSTAYPVPTPLSSRTPADSCGVHPSLPQNSHSSLRSPRRALATRANLNSPSVASLP